MQALPLLFMAGATIGSAVIGANAASSASKASQASSAAATATAQKAQLQQARSSEADAVQTASNQSVGARLAAVSGRRLLTFDGFNSGAPTGNTGMPTGISATLGG